MALTINTIDGRGLSNKAHRELLPKNLKRDQGNTVFAVPSLHSKSRLASCTLLTRRSTSVLKVAMPYRLQSL